MVGHCPLPSYVHLPFLEYFLTLLQVRWDPHREDLLFFNQSATLYATYYHLQIMIHRPFIASPRRATPSPLTFPSLAICTNAARTTCHILDVQSKRYFLPLPPNQVSLTSPTFLRVLIIRTDCAFQCGGGFAPSYLGWQTSWAFIRPLKRNGRCTYLYEDSQDV